MIIISQGKETFKQIIKLRGKYERITMSFGRKTKLSQKTLLYIFSKPVVSIKKLGKELGVAYNTASSIVQEFLKAGILREITGSSRNRLFVLWEYLDLFKR
jgi:Fic family protein